MHWLTYHFLSRHPVTVPPSVAVRNAWCIVGVNVDPIPPPPQGSATWIPPPSGAWLGVCNDDDAIDPPPDLPTRRQKWPRAAQIAPPEPRAPAEATVDAPPPARNVPATTVVQPVRIEVETKQTKGDKPNKT